METRISYCNINFTFCIPHAMHKHKINQIYDPRKIYEIAKVRSLMMGVNHYVLQTYFDFIWTINLQPNATHRWHIQRKHELEGIFFLTRNHLLTQKRFHQNYGLSVIDRTHSFAHEIIIILLLMWCYCCTYLQLFVKSKTNLLEHCWRVERGHLHMHFVGSQTLPDSWQARTSERSRHWQPHNSSRYT